MMVVGLIVSVFAGVQYVTREKVVDIGPIEVMADKNHILDWSPYLGIGIAGIGFITFLVGSKDK